MRAGLVVLCSTFVLCSGLVRSHSPTGPSRKLLDTSSDFYTTHENGHVAVVNTSYMSTSYTTEAQRVQVAQFAQAAAVASAGHFPDLNSTLASQTSSYDTAALLASYEAKKAIAALESSPPPPPSTTTSPASTASVNSAHAMSQEAADSSPDKASDNSSMQQSPDTWTLSSFKDIVKGAKDAAENATEAVKDAAGKLKNEIKGSPKQGSSSPAVQQASVAAVTENVHQPHHTGGSASISASAGPITMYNAYQSSDYDRTNHPASAAIDGDVSTSSQTTVDTASCPNLNEEGLYGTCGLMVGCLSAPAYTQAYASTPNYPFWTAEFSADASAEYKVSHVVLTNRQECCRCPLAGAKIYIGDPAGMNLAQTSNPDLGSDSNWQLCATVPSFDDTPTPYIFSADEKYTETFLCSESLVGKAVAIQLPFPTTILTLAEVEVVGIKT